MELCAVPSCQSFPIKGKAHCKIHIDRFRQHHQRYKKRQERINRYINDPSLINTLTPRELLRVSAISLEVSELRRQFMDTGFRKELQDVGHEKMISLLIMLNFSASRQLTKLFNLPPVDTSKYSNDTVTVDDDGDPTDPQEVVALLRKERDELILQAKKREVQQHKQIKKEGEDLLKRTALQNWEEKKGSIFAVVGFIYTMQEEKKNVSRELVEDVARRMDKLLTSPNKLTTMCPSTGEIDQLSDFVTMYDIDTLFQEGVGAGDLLEDMGERGCKLMWELIEGQCPPGSFIVFYAGSNCKISRFVVCRDRDKGKDKGKEVDILGELIVRLSNKPPPCPHVAINAEGGCMGRCGGFALPMGVGYLKYIYPPCTGK